MEQYRIPSQMERLRVESDGERQSRRRHSFQAIGQSRYHESSRERCADNDNHEHVA